MERSRKLTLNILVLMYMKLHLLEKFILLAHHPEKPRFSISEIQVNYGLTGAILLDLSIQDKIDIKNGNLIINDLNGIDHPISSALAKKISHEEKNKSIKHWILKYGKKASNEKKQLLFTLRDKGFLSLEEKKILWLFPYLQSKVANRPAHEKLVAETKRLILKPSGLTAHETSLLGLVEACKMYKVLSQDKQEIKMMKNCLKDILKESPIAASVDATVKQVQSAIIGSVIASTTATMAATNAAST